MDYKIIVDSCCDITPEMAAELGITTVPLYLRLGNEEYMDDCSLDLPSFMEKMRACTEKVGSAAPSPAAFTQAMTQDSFVVTISSALSATHQNATLGAQESSADVHIFNSKSASAGQTLIMLKLKELISDKLCKSQIVENVNEFIDGMKTYFVLERFDNLVKNGRLSAIKGKFASVLNIKLLLGANESGEISLFAKARGKKQMLDKMLSFISESGRKTTGENAVITHVNNSSLADQLAGMIKDRFDFKKVFVVPTRGTSSLYADNKGIILAF
ncbi:MAG: DegV family protein [Defluviitaleaceae bacterium]|nr:DegV family protein [Defluviitaleaceae bacterium]